MAEIKSTQHLQSQSYYNDLYDRFTVKECRDWEKRGLSKDWDSIEDKDPKKKKIKKEFIVKVVFPTALYFFKGDRYAQKAETIREWMERDRAKDELLDSAKPPEGIHCLSCRSVMTPTFKNLHDWGPEGKDRVLFMYDCPNGCLPRRAFFDNGEEYRPKPHLCPKCKNVLKEVNKKLKNKIITNYTCRRCGYKEKDELDLSSKREKIDKNFAKDRERFCLTEKQGRDYLDFKMKQENLGRMLEEWKKKEKTEKVLAKIKKLPVAGLKQLLTPILEKEGYIKLDFSKPQIDRDIFIQFTVQDNKANRIEYDSRHQLKKAFKKILADTNWRLMSEGIDYKLGILSGRLRGYENEEDLLKLIKK